MFYLKLNAFLILEILVWLVLALLLIALDRTVLSGSIRKLGALFTRLAGNPRLALLVPVLVFLMLRLALLPLAGVPRPGQARDEFSYLLAADTFASGRLTNPPHQLWHHFESPHIIQVPTYTSKYPPAQALFLAAGQVLFHHPWAGILLSMACFIAALGWALRGWLPPSWALFGTLLVVFRIGLISYWVNSYYGGAVAAAAGALVLGAVARLRISIRTCDFMLLACGIGLLAAARPFEGMCAAAPLTIALLPKFYRTWTGKQRKNLLIAAASAGAVLCASFAWLAFYNYRVTGTPLRMPYQVWLEQYAEAPYLIWQHETPKVFRNPGLRAFAEFDKVEMRTYRSPRVRFLAAAKILTAFYWGPVIAVAVLLSLRSIFSSRRLRVPIVAAAISIALMYAESLFFWTSHYLAPLAASLVLIGIAAMRAVSLSACAALRRRRSPPQITAAIVPAFRAASLLAILAVIPVGMRLAESQYSWTLPAYIGRGWCCELNRHQRHIVEERLLNTPGNHLVIVRYPKGGVATDWVYNSASIDQSRIVWAHALSPQEDTELIRYFTGRSVWTAEIGKSGFELKEGYTGD